MDVLRPHFRPDWLISDHSLSESLLELLHLLRWREVLSPFPVMGPLTLNLSSTCADPLHFFQTLHPAEPSLAPFFDSLFWSTGDRAASGSRFKIFTGKASFFAEAPKGNVDWDGCLLPYISECTLIHEVPTSPSSSSPSSSSSDSDSTALITWDDIDAVFIHERLSSSLSELPLQPWHMVVGTTLESPVNDRASLSEDVMRRHTHLFNLHLDSDLLFIYHYPANDVLFSASSPAVPFSERAEGVLWVASNCGAEWRTQGVERLMPHVKINAYGNCLYNMQRKLEDADWKKAKFYLSWENSVCTDYITEKLWRPLADGVVPLYFGAPNVLSFVPTTHAVAPIGAFQDPLQIARFVAFVSQNEAAFQYLIAHRTGQARIRQGFYYYLYMAQTPCEPLPRLCNLVASELSSIRHAKQHNIPLIHDPHHADLSCQ